MPGSARAQSGLARLAAGRVGCSATPQQERSDDKEAEIGDECCRFSWSLIEDEGEGSEGAKGAGREGYKVGKRSCLRLSVIG